MFCKNQTVRSSVIGSIFLMQRRMEKAEYENRSFLKLAYATGVEPLCVVLPEFDLWTLDALLNL